MPNISTENTESIKTPWGLCRTPISTPKCDPESPQRAEHPKPAENGATNAKQALQEGAWRGLDHEGEMRGKKQNSGLNCGLGHVLSVLATKDLILSQDKAGRTQHSPNLSLQTESTFKL